MKNLMFAIIIAASPLNYVKDVKLIFKQRCTSCHNGGNSLTNFSNYESVYINREKIYNRVVITRTMPLGNSTKMTIEERNKIASWIKSGTSRGSVYEAFYPMSKKYKVPVELLHAICEVETAGLPIKIKPNDGGSASYGVCQVKLGTAQLMDDVYKTKHKATSKRLQDQNINIQYAAMYLKWQLDRYDDDWFEAVSAYNRGSYFEGHGYNYVEKVINVMRIK